MDKNRAIAWLIAISVTLVIIMVGKAAMGTPDTSGLKKNKKQPKQEAVVTTAVSIYMGEEKTEPPVLDIFGRPVTATTTVDDFQIDINDIKEMEGYEETPVTDVFGNPVTTAIETDAFGNLVTTVAEESVDAVTAENAPVETTTLSPEEQYQEDMRNPIGGFNHDKYDEDGNVIPTLPPDFAIIIN